MRFEKAIMTRSELVKVGMPECILDEIYNDPELTIGFKGQYKNSPICFFTKELEQELTKRTKLEKARRGIYGRN